MNQVVLNQGAPVGYPTDALQSQLNTQIASAYAMGDPRFNAKSYDRPGLSRGRGQWNQAGIDAAKGVVSGVADAYSRHLQGLGYNADTALQGQYGREQMAQALGGLQQQRDYAQQMSALQREQAAMGLYSGLLKGLMD